MIRLPFGPLESEMERRHDRRLTDNELALMLGITDRQVRVYRTAGLSAWKADEYAIRLNMHPIYIWGLDLWSGAIDVTDEETP